MVPAAAGALEQRREATFPTGRGFDDRLTVVSGAMEIDAGSVGKSAGFFRSSGGVIDGLTAACWQDVATLPARCVQGLFTLEIPDGASFGYKPATPYSATVEARHALTTFVDLSQADGFDEKLRVGPSVISSLVGGTVSLSGIGPSEADRRHGFSVLEAGAAIELRDATGLLVHRLRVDDGPLVVEGKPVFPRELSVDVLVLPFEDGATARFKAAAEADAADGLAESRMRMLDEILADVRIIDSKAKAAPFEILSLADELVNEVFNGAFIRASLADKPQGLGDVGFAKFEDLTVTEDGGLELDFDGSYTLVVGDLGPSFDDTAVSHDAPSLRWWVGILAFLAIVAVAAWLWFRDGPVQRPEPGPQTVIARVATAAGVLLAFVLWDWQMNEVLGSSMFTTDASGAALGIIIFVELASLALAGLLIGVPVFLIARHTLALAKWPKYASLATTAAVFMTAAFGILLLPALVSFLAAIAS